jgi:hypothetical protein
VRHFLRARLLRQEVIRRARGAVGRISVYIGLDALTVFVCWLYADALAREVVAEREFLSKAILYALLAYLDTCRKCLRQGEGDLPFLQVIEAAYGFRNVKVNSQLHALSVPFSPDFAHSRHYRLVSTYPIIFPSLSRQPSMDSSKTTEDDTIRDQMESGYVATRPRFTRTRRTWKLNTRNLQAEDVRALDEFFMVTTARGGNSFLYPNLLQNWSFEFPAVNPGDLVFGWNRNDTYPQLSVTTTATALDGTTAIEMSTVAGQEMAANATIYGQLLLDKLIPCQPNEVYQFNASYFINQGHAGVTVNPMIAVIPYDANGNDLGVFGGYFNTFTPGVWISGSTQFVIPANAASIALYVQAVFECGASALTLNGATSVVWDEVGCALLTPLTPYGRMAGSAPLGCLVRFSKLPEVSDIGFGGGVKRYGAAFELTEV